jgi:hypothetical protein
MIGNNTIEEDLIITGEWCEGVLREFGLEHFAGRAIQYYLGFHHATDICRYAPFVTGKS